jgi:hypothetical protein
MKITPGASFGVAAKTVRGKNDCIARQQMEKRCKSFTRNVTKLREEDMMKQLIGAEKIIPPTPAVVLSREQWNAQKDISIVLKYDGALKDKTEGCWCPKWQVMWKGENYTTQEGSLVFDADSAGLHLDRKDRAPFFRDVVMEGGSLPNSNPLVVLATWTTASPEHEDNDTDESPVYTSALLNSIGVDKHSILPVDGKKHHGSCGLHYAYGSVASYGSLKNRTEGNSVCIFAGNNKHEHTLARSVAIGARSIDRKFTRNNIPGGSIITKATIMTHSVKRAAAKVNTLLRPHIVNITGTRFPAVFLCVDAFTLKKHTEKDCSYTLITVPKQEGLGVRETSGYFFNFYLNNENGDIISVPMQVGTSICFSGHFLTHNQSRASDHVPTFVNISAYGNQRLYQNSQCTIKRNAKKN